MSTQSRWSPLNYPTLETLEVMPHGVNLGDFRTAWLLLLMKLMPRVAEVHFVLNKGVQRHPYPLAWGFHCTASFDRKDRTAFRRRIPP
jgi:hypothetical protein